MLGDGDLEYMRASIELLLPDTCSVLTASLTPDGQGGAAETWGTALSNVKCRLDPGRKEAVNRITGAALQPYSYWYLTLPHATAIDERSRIEHGGNTYAVIGADPGKSWAGSVRAMVIKLWPSE